MNLPDLNSLIKENKIKGTSLMNKPEKIAILVEKGIIPEESLKKPKVQERREVDPKYLRLKDIRNNPMAVKIRDLELGTVTIYPSIYKVRRATRITDKTLRDYDGKVLRGRYEINIIK
jgi:hypothetical protein